MSDADSSPEDAVERVARAIAKVSLESPHGRDCLCEQCGLARARAAIEAMPPNPTAVSNDRCVYPGCSRPDDKERHEWNDMHDWVPCCGAAQAKGPVLAVPFTEQEFLTRVFDWCEDWLEAHDKGVRPDVDYKAREFYRKHLSAQSRTAITKEQFGGALLAATGAYDMDDLPPLSVAIKAAFEVAGITVEG